uniref:G-protein coupled receptors family 1 profile domain-containing protein n=1 Tax=Plectus sambesii TaxID=2011161 RepID=A0A914XSB4_9BILA
MMNDSVILAEFYGPTLSWFRPIFGLLCLLAVLGNGLLIWIALTTPSIRSVNSNWFVISMGISDFLWGFYGSVLSSIAFSCGSDGSCPTLVKISGGFCISTIESSFVFPTFIVINRYVKVTTLPGDSGRLRRFLVSSKGILIISGCAWIYVIVLSSILAIFDQLGEDPFGVYCANHFKSFWLYLVYMTGGMYAMSSYTATFYFYSKLQKFVATSIARVNANRPVRRNAFHTRQQDHQEGDTKAVMKMVKLSTLLPLVLQGGVFVIDGGQWFLPDDLLPMWGGRLFSIAFAIMPMCSPWILLLTLGPFKRELKRRWGVALRRTNSVTAVASVM